MKLTLKRPWLVIDLDAPLRVLSWSLTRPGFVTAQHIVWREVRNADLPTDLDAASWFYAELARVGHERAVPFLTSRDIRHYQTATADVAGTRAEAIATVGLSNAERIGQRQGAVTMAGTINIAVKINTPLSDAALLEVLSLTAKARTVAVMEHGPDLPAGRATGTGTDCIAIAAPPGPKLHAGMHTAIGEAVGRAVLHAVTHGVQDWMKDWKNTQGD